MSQCMSDGQVRHSVWFVCLCDGLAKLMDESLKNADHLISLKAVESS